MCHACVFELGGGYSVHAPLLPAPPAPRCLSWWWVLDTCHLHPACISICQPCTYGHGSQLCQLDHRQHELTCIPRVYLPLCAVVDADGPLSASSQHRSHPSSSCALPACTPGRHVCWCGASTVPGEPYDESSSFACTCSWLLPYSSYTDADSRVVTSGGDHQSAWWLPF
jgi:hypothetical protein